MQVRHFLILPSLLLASTAMAQTVNEGEALDKALSFVSSQQRARGAQNAARLTLAHKAAAQDETYYYVFNNAEGGFVIVGGDESAEDVLGYCDKGSFDPDNLPDNFRWWLSTYEQSISRSIRARKANGEAQQRAPRRAKANLTNIEPMIKTQWDQTYPFNQDIPGNDAKPYRWYTGCVTTAVAQIMKYYEWPEHGWKLHQYEGNVSPYYMYSANFAEGTYDWDNMIDSYEDDYTDAQADAVAQLMYHVGVASEAKFGRGLTLSNTTKAVCAMRRNFGYKQGTEKTKNNYDGDWEELVYSELAAERPVLYSGRTADDAGHTFVCDGYQDGKFHINWGWSGYCDGYYLLTSTDSETALQPGGSGSGGAGDDDAYNQRQSIFIGLEPDYDYNGGVTIASISNQGMCSRGEDFELTLTLDNRSSDKIAASYVLVFLDDEYNEIGAIDLDVLNFEPNETGVRVTVTNPDNLDCLAESGKQLKAELINIKYWMPEDACTVTLCETAPNITYTLTDAEWGTICLPFDAEIPEAITAYTVTGVNANDALVLQKAAKLEMNKAYLIHGTPGKYRFGGPDTPRGVYQNGLLHGVTKIAGEYAPKGSYVLQNQPEGLGFYVVQRNYNIKAKAYTAYLEVSRPSGAPIYIDTETGIQRVELDAAEKAEILNVLGQRCADGHGLRIKDGKLMFVK